MFVNDVVFSFYITNLETVVVHVTVKRQMPINYSLKLFTFCKSNVLCKKNPEDLKQIEYEL